LGGLVLSFLLVGFVLVLDFLFSHLLRGGCSLALLDFSHCLVGQSFLFFGAGIFEFFDVIESDPFDGSLFSEDFLLFIFADVGLL